MYQRKLAHPLTLGLALVTGGGLILMIYSLAAGAVQGAAANTSTFNAAFAIGVALFLCGIVGWFVVVQPFRNFDDINVPKDSGHHASPAAHDSAIVAAEAHDVEPHAHG